VQGMVPYSMGTLGGLSGTEFYVGKLSVRMQGNVSTPFPMQRLSLSKCGKGVA
jgi:hypothetical protein